MNARLPRWLIAVAGVVYLFLHLPILVLVVFSFNDSKFSVEWRGFTLQWYQRLLERPDILRGLEGQPDRRRGGHASSRRCSAP